MATMTDVSLARMTLREKQSPLKEKYQSDPSSALLVLGTTGTLDESAPYTCCLKSATSEKKIAGLHSAAGGEDLGLTGELCSGDMLLESIVACYGVAMRAIATSMGIHIHGGTLTCTGVLDLRGTLGIKDENGNSVPVGFKSISLIARPEVDDIHRGRVARLIELSEKYCVVLQTIAGNCKIQTTQGHTGRSMLPDTRSDIEFSTHQHQIPGVILD